MSSISSQKGLLFISVLICFACMFSLQLFASDVSEYLDSYIVKRGDTLYDIALLYNTTPDIIAAQNAITNPDLIHPGQTLTIPIDESNYIGGGFSFASEPINGYQPAFETIDGYTFINDSKIIGLWKNVGTCVRIEDFKDSIPQQLEYIRNNTSEDIYFAEYGDIKKGGDFAWSAGTIYNYPDKSKNSDYVIRMIGGFKYMFAAYNSKNQLFSEIKNIPSGTKYIVYRKYEKVHMVKPGDTLNEIAEAYGLSADYIAYLNEIDDIDQIFVFQKLRMSR